MARARGSLWSVSLGCGALVAVGASVLLARAERRALSADLASPRDLHRGAYAGSAACRRCHPDHYQSWARTFHRSMTEEASQDSVRGDFSGATLRLSLIHI